MTNPTLEQVEAARAEYDRSEDMCAALVAAAGAASQERGEVLQRAHEVIKGVYANELRLPAYMLSRQAALALKQDDLLAAPVPVDEAKLAEAIAEELNTDGWIAEEWSNGKLNATARRLVEFAVLPVLRGGGQ